MTARLAGQSIARFADMARVVADRLLVDGVDRLVFTGVCRADGRPVVVKALYGDRYRLRGVRRRFHTEAEIVLGCHHPAIVSGRVMIDDGERAVLVLEHRGDLPLHERVARSPIGLDELCAVVTRIADGLQHLHDQGWLHGDLKADNVVWAVDGDHCLVDFELARRWPFEVPRRVPGNPHYQAPEAIRPGGVLGPATDVYALGVMLYELLAGRRPIDAPTEDRLLDLQVHTEPTPLRAIAPWVPEAVGDAVMAALAKDSADRPATAPDLARRLAVGAADHRSTLPVVSS